MRLRGITVFISVDSELATSTKTSASRQNLSIQLSSSDVTSVPGLGSGREVKRSNLLNLWSNKSTWAWVLFCTYFALNVLETVKLMFANVSRIANYDQRILLPVNKHQVVSKQSTLGLWPKHTDKAAGVQTLIHVECMSQLVYSLQKRCKQTDVRVVNVITSL